MTKERLSFIGGAIFVMLVAYFMLPVFIPNVHSDIKTDPFWVTSVNKETGNLTVFSLTLNRSTLEDAKAIFGNRLSLSVFHDIQANDIQLEGYFRETTVGEATGQPFTGRIALSLKGDKETLLTQLEAFEKDKKSISTRTIYNIPADQQLQFDDEIITSLSFMPTAIRLSEEDIYNRFGEPEKIVSESINTNTIHYLYSLKGIDVAIDEKDKFRSVIQYFNPNDFNETILTPLL